jgi:hypothetical protein
MKLLFLVLAALTIANQGCGKKNRTNQGKNSAMHMDSSYAGDKNVTVVQAKDTIRLNESMKNFEDNPNIARADIDAGKRIESKEVQYVKNGDTIRISEDVAKEKIKQ